MAPYSPDANSSVVEAIKPAFLIRTGRTRSARSNSQVMPYVSQVYYFPQPHLLWSMTIRKTPAGNSRVTLCANKHDDSRRPTSMFRKIWVRGQLSSDLEAVGKAMACTKAGRELCLWAECNHVVMECRRAHKAAEVVCQLVDHGLPVSAVKWTRDILDQVKQHARAVGVPLPDWLDVRAATTGRVRIPRAEKREVNLSSSEEEDRLQSTKLEQN